MFTLSIYLFTRAFINNSLSPEFLSSCVRDVREKMSENVQMAAVSDSFAISCLLPLFISFISFLYLLLIRCFSSSFLFFIFSYRYFISFDFFLFFYYLFILHKLVHARDFFSFFPPFPLFSLGKKSLFPFSLILLGEKITFVWNFPQKPQFPLNSQPVFYQLFLLPLLPLLLFTCLFVCLVGWRVV